MFSGLLSLVWTEFGKSPSGELAEKIAQSPNFDQQTQRFVNRNQDAYDEMVAGFDYMAMFKAQVFGKQIRTPPKPLPQRKPDLSKFSSTNGFLYHWLGHSTVLLRIQQKTLLLDPVFTNAAPVPFAVPRFQAPVVDLEGLPDVDLILISHDHYDHLDKASIQFFTDKKTAFIVPLGLSSHLISWGIDESRITELDWWEEAEFQGLTVACTPSQHFSGRTGPNGNDTLWGSWVVFDAESRFYFSGDSGYDTHFKAIGDKYGPFDIAFIESGQYNSIWPMSHMSPEESVKAGLDLNAQKIQPIHWGMFKLSTHDWNEPPEEVLRIGTENAIQVVTPQLGEPVFPHKLQTFSAWWRE